MKSTDITENLTGQRFGLLTVTGQGEKKGRRSTWHCVCACGGEKDVKGHNLKSGNVRSCGCLGRLSKHGALRRELYMNDMTEHPMWTEKQRRAVEKALEARKSFERIERMMALEDAGRKLRDVPSGKPEHFVTEFDFAEFCPSRVAETYYW